MAKRRTSRASASFPGVVRGAGVSPHWPEADRSRFTNPFDDRTLLEYYTAVFDWHGYIRFLGLPHLGDNPDQPIQDLFVEPRLSRPHINPDTPPSQWPETELVLDRLRESPRLVVLGDPGSGKSTLVSWLAWLFTRPRESVWTEALGQLVPLPFVLRELSIDKSITWPRLLEEFIRHSVGRPLGSRRKVEEILERGQAFLLLDGLDEIGSVSTRKALRDAVHAGIEAFPTCRWLFTSRIVGYDQVPFHSEYVSVSSTRHHADDFFEGYVADPCHIAPFSDDQMERFAQHWYATREVAEAAREQGARDLVRAIRANEGTQRLARIPNLLTLMALIHRIQRRLPHGRALLYDKITEAYLESIDTFRGIQELDYPLKQKKRWLANVGFQMQRRRATGEERKHEQQEILVGQKEVQSWIAEAMTGVDSSEAARAAARFVDYVGRRTGLLLPRGEGQYAFTHLSFQEYFAACRLEEQIVSPYWPMGKKVAEGASKEDLRAYANESVWRETLVLLFEILGDRPDWVEILTEALFEQGFQRLAASQDDSQQAAAELLAGLSIDLHAGLSPQQRLRAWERCWEWELAGQQRLGWPSVYFVRPAVGPTLASAERDDEPAIWSAFKRISARLELKNLSLAGCTRLADLSALVGLKRLEALSLFGCTGVSELSPLAGLEQLSYLDVSGCTGVTDLSPLARLKQVERLFLPGCTGVTDLSPLVGLKQLGALSLAGCTGVTDLSPLAGLEQLKRLFLSGCTNIKSIPSELLDKKDLTIHGATELGLAKPSASKRPNRARTEPRS